MSVFSLVLLALPPTFAAAPASADTRGADETAPVPADRLGPSPIINGEDATRDDYPMTGGMLLDADLSMSGTDYHLRMLVCSSTLIAPDVVLLAAHCVDPDVLTGGFGTLENTDIRWTREADLTAFDGSSRGTPDWPDDAVQAADWVAHPDWDYSGLGMGLSENRDIALLFLDEPVLDVPYAYLATQSEAEQIEEGLVVEVVGWGQQEATESQWEAPPSGTYAIKQMGESYLNEVNRYEMQVGGARADVRKCHGDSGGPTFLSITTDTADSTRLIGVTSHAYDTSDCNEVGGVDTRVDHYLAWIEEELQARCADGSRAWCEQTGIPDPTFVPVEEVVDEGGDEVEGPGGCGCDTMVPGALGGLLMQGLLMQGLAVAALVRRRA